MWTPEATETAKDMKNEPIKVIKLKNKDLLFFKNASFSPKSPGDGFYILTVMLKKKKTKQNICYDLMICDNHSHKYKVFVIREVIKWLNDIAK